MVKSESINHLFLSNSQKTRKQSTGIKINGNDNPKNGNQLIVAGLIYVAKKDSKRKKQAMKLRIRTILRKIFSLRSLNNFLKIFTCIEKEIFFFF